MFLYIFQGGSLRLEMCKITNYFESKGAKQDGWLLTQTPEINFLMLF